MSKTENNLGQKIREFRKRVGMSQMEVEIAINGSNGMLSRIENGVVDPSKETLSRLANILELNSTEIMDLLDLNIITTEELIQSMNLLSQSLKLSDVLQTSVDIIFNLYPNYNGGVILLYDKAEHCLHSKTVSNMPKIEIVHRMLPKNLFEYFISLDSNESLIADTFNNLRNNSSNTLHDFSRGSMPDWIADKVAIILGFQYGLSMPLLYNDKPLGVVLYTKRVSQEFTKYEHKLLSLLNGQIAIAIINAERYERLKTKINTLKNERK